MDAGLFLLLLCSAIVAFETNSISDNVYKWATSLRLVAQVFDRAIKNGFRLPMLTHRSISV
jgi:hypothetical protein